MDDKHRSKQGQQGLPERRYARNCQRASTEQQQPDRLHAEELLPHSLEKNPGCRGGPSHRQEQSATYSDDGKNGLGLSHQNTELITPHRTRNGVQEILTNI